MDQLTRRTVDPLRRGLAVPYRWASQLGVRRDLALPAGFLVLQLGGAAIVASRHGSQSPLSAVDWLCLAVGPLALTARRGYPVVALWLALLATFAPSGSRLAYPSLILAFFVAAIGGHRRAAWVVIVAGYVGSIWLAPLAYGKSPASAQVALLLLGWLAVLVIAAEAVHMAKDRRAEAAVTRRLDAQRRASEERLSVARDLHDVIGHHVSLINIQASVGLDLADAHPEQARVALEAIKGASKEALFELRSMLAALHRGDEDAPRSPTPGLSRLPELVAATRAAGLSVTTEVRGRERRLPIALDVAAYRIIQESLTNVTRHAGPATARVRLRYEADALFLEIVNNGHPRPTIGAPGPGSGTGIDGMRERAAALGGQLEAGPCPGGGFAVTASLPLGARS